MYSDSVKARIYKQAAEQMPKMFVLAAFGGADIKQSIQTFFSLWEKYEAQFTEADLKIVQLINMQDRG